MHTFIIFCAISQLSAADDAKNESTKVSDFRNKFEKFGAPKQMRKPSIPACGNDTTDGVDKINKQARDLAEQLQKQLAEQENIRLIDRQQLINKMQLQQTQFETEIKAIKEKNVVVSDSLSIILFS